MSQVATSHAPRFIPKDAKGLEELIRQQFPLIFGDRDLVATEDFIAAYKDMADFTAKSAEPPFKTETHKQQGMLAAASIGLISLVVFQVSAIKIGDATVAVDDRLLAWYAAFLVVMLIVFCLRAILDFRRAALALLKDADKPDVLGKAVQLAHLRRVIQLHFWLKLFDGIGQCYDTYIEAQTPGAASSHIPLQAVSLNFAELRKVEEFRQQIDSHEAFVDDLLRELEHDVGRFEDRVLEFDNPVPAKPAKGGKSWQRHAPVQQLFEKTLRPWFDARNVLSSTNLDAVTDERSMREHKMMMAQNNLLKRALRIRRLYAFTELALPLMLAAGAIGYLWLSR